MPKIYYTDYIPISDSIPEVCSQEHVLGRTLLAAGLRALCHIDVSPDELSGMLGMTENGKPFLPGFPDIHFNISHCDRLVVCAFHNSPIGADAEIPGYFAKVLINRALSDDEKSFLRSVGVTPALEEEWFYRFWTLKEAYVKMTGTGVDVDLTGFSFRFSGNQEPFQIQCSDPSVCCWQKKLSGGQILSLCCENSRNAPMIQPELLYQRIR